MVVTPDGLPLGIIAQEIWARDPDAPVLSDYERRKQPIEQKESYKWITALRETVQHTPADVQVVSVCDRELVSVIAWRLYWMTHINRQTPEASCVLVLAEHEWHALYATIHRTTHLPTQPPTVRQAVRWIAQLGGFLARKGDGEPGITVIWRGWQRLHDISTTWLILRKESYG